MAIVGPRGYPGSKGLTGNTGIKGDTGNAGQNVTVTDNGDGTFTLTGANGSVIVSNGSNPVKGSDYFDGNTGDYVSFVYAKVLNGAAAPTITDGTGTFDGLLETLPTGSVTWTDEPNYEIGYTTYVSSNRYQHDITTGGSGTWTLRNQVWATPKIFTEAVGIQTQLVSYAFIRDITQPTTPVGGTYSSPIPTTAGWTDGIPTGSTPVYMVKRLFTSDGLSPESATWSTPQLLGASGSGTKLQFGPTNTGPWDDIPDPADEWMISCVQDNAGTFVCNTANPVKIKGETGPTSQTSFKAYAFKRAVGTLTEIPTGGTFSSPVPVDGVVTGWTGNIPAGTANLYVSTRLFTSDGLAPQDSAWTTSQLFSGEGAITYSITADAQVFSFDAADANPAPVDITFTANKQNLTTLTDWTTVPVITIAANPTQVDTFTITAAEFGLLTSLKVIGTNGSYSDEITIVRVKDGAAGPAGGASETREVRFQFAPDSGGSPGTWHDKPMLGTDDWIREGTFYDNVLQGSYSAGTQITGNDGADTYTEFWFGDVNATGDPDSTPADWSQTQTASDVYIISRTTTLGVAGAWGAITQIRGNDGVDGKFFETRFAVGDKDTAPLHDATSPVFPNYDQTLQVPAGWVTDPNLTVTPSQVIWAITATKNADGTLDTNWTSPAVQWGAYTPVRGTDYSDGTGVYLSKVYKEAADGYNTPPTINTGSWDGTTEVLPSGGWSDDPMSPSPGNFVYESNFLYVSSLIAGVNTWPANAGTWSTPTKYAYIPTLGTDYTNGTDGADGDGSFHSYVFKNAPIGTDLSGSAPVDGSYNGTEVLPVGWTDDPVTPTSDEITWVTERTYISLLGVWQSPPAWSDPSKFSAITSLVGVLSNETDAVTSDFNGNNIVFSGNEGGSFIVYFGILDVTANCVYTVAGGSVNGANHELTQNSLTMSINQSTGVYTVTGSGWSSDKETFTLVATHTASGAIATKKYTLIKTKDGDVGLSGTANRLDIAYGTSSSGGTVSYPPAASPSGKAYIGTNIVTWIPPAAEPAVSTTATDYEWSKFVAVDGSNGSNGSNGLSSRVDFAYSDSDNGVGNPLYPTAGPVTPLASSKYLGTNVVTWDSSTSAPAVSTTAGDYEWSRYTGQDGTDALTILNYTPAVSLAADNTGAVLTYANSGTTISIYEGETKLTYDAVGTSSGTWDIGAVSDVNINVGSISISGGDAIIGNSSAMLTSADNAFITFPVTGKRLNGTSFTAQITQVISKSSAGIAALSAVLSNPSHTIPTDSSGGNGDYTGSGTTITLYEGSTRVPYDGVGTTDSSWKVVAAPSNITNGTISDSGDFATVADASGFTAGITPLTASISYVITGKTSDGTPINITVQQSFNKNLDAVQLNPIQNSASGPYASTTMTHVSVGNPNTINWSALIGASGISVNGPPTGSPIAQLKRDGTIIATADLLNVINSSEPGFGAWRNKTGVITTIDNTTATTHNYTVNVVQNSSDTLNENTVTMTSYEQQ